MVDAYKLETMKGGKVHYSFDYRLLLFSWLAAYIIDTERDRL